MKIMAGAPFSICARSSPSLAELEVGCSASTGRWGEGFHERNNVGSSCDLGSGSRRIRNFSHEAIHFRNCDLRRRRDSYSICEGRSSQNRSNLFICNVFFHGEQDVKGAWKVRAQHLGFERKGGTLGSNLRGALVRNPLSVATREELVDLIVRRHGAIGGRRRKGLRSFTVYASLDPYEVLGVPSTATDKEIKQAYRKLALKLHPDVNKQPDAPQQFLRVKNAYQTLTDETSRAKYEASKRGSPSWDPFGWDSKTRTPPEQKEEFYGFNDFFRDLQSDSRKQASKPKSLWEELADIGEEFVEFLEKELNINDTAAREERASSEKRKSDAREAKKKSEGPAQSAPRNQEADKVKVETDIEEIEDMLAQLKKELGI